MSLRVVYWVVGVCAMDLSARATMFADKAGDNEDGVAMRDAGAQPNGLSTVNLACSSCRGHCLIKGGSGTDGGYNVCDRNMNEAACQGSGGQFCASLDPRCARYSWEDTDPGCKAGCILQDGTCDMATHTSSLSCEAANGTSCIEWVYSPTGIAGLPTASELTAQRNECFRNLGLAEYGGTRPGGAAGYSQLDNCHSLNQNTCEKSYMLGGRAGKYSSGGDASGSPFQYALDGEITFCKWAVDGTDCGHGSPVEGFPQAHQDLIDAEPGRDKTYDTGDESTGNPVGGCRPNCAPSAAAGDHHVCPEGQHGAGYHIITTSDTLATALLEQPDDNSPLERTVTRQRNAISVETRHYAGVTIAEQQNWCRHLETHLQTPVGTHRTRLQNETCSSKNEAQCENYYEDANSDGTFAVCQWSDTASCAADVSYNCTWTFYMEDMIRATDSEHRECYGEILETKRSLDFLLHEVIIIRDQIYQQNMIISEYNRTIRELLQEQQDLWNIYETAQDECMTNFTTDRDGRLAELYEDILELEMIARPDIRSAVDRNRSRGYQSADYSPGGAGAVNEWHPDGYVPQATNQALVELDSKACETSKGLLSSLAKKVRRNYPVVERSANFGSTTVDMEAFNAMDCHAQRNELSSVFNQAVADMKLEIYGYNISIHRKLTTCLSQATYDYKSAVEGDMGIDDRIQTAAQYIHAAQSVIAGKEPRLHDVEHAARRVTQYVEELNASCDLADNVTTHLKNIRTLILQLQECPGRNDFVIHIPHVAAVHAATPAPTPWYMDPKNPDPASLLEAGALADESPASFYEEPAVDAGLGAPRVQ